MANSSFTFGNFDPWSAETQDAEPLDTKADCTVHWKSSCPLFHMLALVLWSLCFRRLMLKSGRMGPFQKGYCEEPLLYFGWEIDHWVVNWNVTESVQPPTEVVAKWLVSIKVAPIEDIYEETNKQTKIGEYDTIS